MTFQEYLEQEEPTRQYNVKVREEDCYHISDYIPGYRKVIVLKIHGFYYPYVLPEDNNRLYTMDKDGNKKSGSCFVFDDGSES